MTLDATSLVKVKMGKTPPRVVIKLLYFSLEASRLHKLLTGLDPSLRNLLVFSFIDFSSMYKSRKNCDNTKINGNNQIFVENK